MKNFTIPRSSFSKTIGCFVLFFLLATQSFAQPGFSKVFTPNTIGPGSSSLLTFTIDNTGSVSPAINLDFADVLPGSGTIVVADAPSINNTCGGTVTALAGTDLIALTGGNVGGSSTCMISVNVTCSIIGTHTNLTGDLTSSAGNSGSATDDLDVVTTFPGFTKSFSPSIVDVGDRSTLTFTFDNSLNGNRIGSLDFTDNLPTGLVVANPSNASTTCISASAPDTELTAVAGTSVITLNADGSTLFAGFEVLAANGTCFVTVDVVAEGVGDLENATEGLATGSSVGYATDVISSIRSDIHITKEFLADPVPPGGTVDLEFTITNFDRDFPATDVTFSDNLSAVLPGLVPIGLPLTDVCGVGSTVTAATSTSIFQLTGGTVPQNNGSCTFTVTLQVPATATIGSYNNTTSLVSGMVNGGVVTGNDADDDLFIAPAPVITKNFLDDPIRAGSNTTLEFTITNTSATDDLTDIAFTDNLTDMFGVFPITVSYPAAGFCGGSSMIGSSFPDIDQQAISMTGGSLTAGSSCTFTVEITVPDGLSGGVYNNTTSDITGTVNGEAVTGVPATDDLTILAAPQITKSFTNDPANPGGTVDLEFNISLTGNAPTDATNISFTDDLDAMLTGSVATGLPMNNICGTGSSISGTSTLTFTGGTLAAGSTCTFTVTVQVPGGATPGTYTNITTDVTATVAATSVTGNAATDDLVVNPLTFTKEFINDPVVPGDLATLRFTIDLDASSSGNATGMVFTDNLATMFAGAASESGTLNNICGAGSSISGTTLLIFTGGNLTPGTSCTFDIQMRVPGGTTNDTYNNLTSSLTATLDGNVTTANPATDQLVVSDELLDFSKSFTPNPVMPGATVDLEFTIENTHPTEAVSTIAFTDDLSAMLPGLVATGLPMAGCGGTISGTNMLTFSAGSLPAASTCTFTVTLQSPATAGGTFTNNTSAITGDIGGFTVNGPVATADLTIANLGFTMAYANPVMPGGTTTLSFSITNLDASSPVSNIMFNNVLNALIPGMTMLGAPIVNSCGVGSTITGTSSINFSGGSLAAGGNCTFDVTVQVPSTATDGIYPNTTSDISGIGGSGAFTSAPAMANLIVSTILVPTLSEWGLIILALLIMIIGTVKVAEKQIVFAGENAQNISSSFFNKLPFNKLIFKQALTYIISLAIVIGIFNIIAFGTIATIDILGTMIAGSLFAYLIHLIIFMEKNNHKN